MKKLLLCICVYTFLVSFLFAGGKVETRTVENPESWNEAFDLSEKKSGKYNVLVTAEDSAGNIGEAGPFNMYIDPRSDLPVVSITNPIKNMSVIGSFSASGTCFDDDDIDYVEVALDGGDPVRAKGKQFWSCFFNTANLEEGPHYITAWGVDVNGLKGNDVSVPFNLNLNTPETLVTNMDTGALISGKRTLEGIVQDGNGISKFFYSLDAGQTYTPLSLKYNKKNKVSTFKLTIDTSKMPEGPTVCWFKAIDKLGAEGISTFLFFIDNTAPVVDFFYPPDSESVGSVFGIAGSAIDTVDLESVSWKIGNQAGAFELVKGNPYWVKEFDVSSSSSKTETVEITAKDVAGNITTVKRTIKIDKLLDAPRVTIAQPVANAVTGNSIYLAGSIESVSGVSEVRYKIDKEGEKTVPVSMGAFGVPITDISSGAHTISVYAVNPQGVKGHTETVSFSVMGTKPVIGLEGTGAVVQSVALGSRASAAINVSAGAGLEAVSYTIADNAEIPVSIKKGAVSTLIRIPIDSSFSGKVIPVAVHAVDIYGRAVSQTVLIDSQAAAEEEAFVWAEGDKSANGAFILPEHNTLTGVYHPVGEAEIASVELAGSAIPCELSFSGHVITLTVPEEGSYKNIQIAVTDTEGRTFTSPGIDIFIDKTAPVITLSIAEDTQFIKDSLELTGSVSDTSALQSVTYTVGDSEALPLSSAKFSQKIALDSYPDGLVVVGVHAVDVLGQKSSAYRTFYKNSHGPQVSLLLPREGDKVNGSILVAFKPDNYSLLEKVEYKPEGSNHSWESMEISSLPHRIIGTASAPIGKGMLFRFTDKAGNVSTYNDYSFEIDTESDKPVIEVHLPEEDAVVVKDFVLSGVVYDDDGVSKVFYQIDDGAIKTLDVTNTFAVPFALTDFTDNQHTVSIYAEDIYGVKSNVFKRKVRVSLAPPSLVVQAPVSTAMVKDFISITGTASDKNGIKSIEVSLDNGNTYSRAEGGENWHYDFNTSVIADGTHVVFIKAIDQYNQESVASTLVNIDNTAPVLKFEYPLPGGKYDGELLVSGQVYDEIALKDVVIHIKGLQGQTVPAKFLNMALEPKLIATKNINITELPEGSYNLEIVGSDAAGNVTNLARNFVIDRSNDKGKIDLLAPLTGETLTGEFNIYGKISSTIYPDSVTLYIDGAERGTASISPTGYFSFRITPEGMTEGEHKILVKAEIVKNKPESSVVHSITYKPTGPWVTVDNFAMGDFAVDRPYLKGTAGYILSEEETLLLQDNSTAPAVRQEIAAKKLAAVEISLNNGRTFIPLGSKAAWKYRLETGDMAEGEHFLLVRARMANNEVAVCRMIVSIDKTTPEVTLITPDEGGTYNQSLTYAGLATDNVTVTNVTLALRKGDKFLYGVPTIVQGLHFDLGFWGSTLWNMGVGLSFFSNNVKLQLHYGQFLQSQWDLFHKGKLKMRYGGHVVSMKILANVFELPFESFAGPDWSWLYMTGSLGANFSVFTQTQKGKPQVLAAMLAQIEFPRVKLPKKQVKYCRSFAFYTEGQLWFIPTDVSEGTKTTSTSKISAGAVWPHISVGIRLDVF